MIRRTILAGIAAVIAGGTTQVEQSDDQPDNHEVVSIEPAADGIEVSVYNGGSDPINPVVWLNTQPGEYEPTHLPPVEPGTSASTVVEWGPLSVEVHRP